MAKIQALIAILFHVWSLESSSKWTAQNPAAGQCGVTALVVQDICGGEILKTQVEGQWHYYNRINGQRYDLTASQFAEEIPYTDVASNREEAFADTNEQQYHYLRENVYARL